MNLTRDGYTALCIHFKNMHDVWLNNIQDVAFKRIEQGNIKETEKQHQCKYIKNTLFLRFSNNQKTSVFVYIFGAITISELINI